MKMMTLRPCSSSARTLAYALLASLVVILSSLSSVAEAQQKIKQQDLGSDAFVPLRTHSIYAPYVESTLQNRFWDYGGDTIIDTNRHVRLTQDKPHQIGWLWSRLPITSESFEVGFEFKVDGQATNTYGDGLAMWLTEERATSGPVFGSKDYFTGLGIFFDTFANARHPYSFPRIMAMNGNGVESYRGDKDGANQELGGCSIDIRRTRVASKAKLTFVKDVYLELKVQHSEWDEWETCFKLEDVKLPQRPYLGFSALTGDVSDAHDVVSVSSSSIVYKNRSYSELAAERLKHFPKDGSKSPYDTSSSRRGKGLFSSTGGFLAGFFHGLFTFLWFLIKWGLVVAVIAGLAVVGLRWRKARDAKRF